MFFLNGLKNIKIILIVSIIIFLITSILINLNLKKTKNAEIAFVCSDHYSFGKTETEDHARMKESHIYLNFCNNFKSYIDNTTRSFLRNIKEGNNNYKKIFRF